MHWVATSISPGEIITDVEQVWTDLMLTVVTNSAHHSSFVLLVNNTKLKGLDQLDNIPSLQLFTLICHEEIVESLLVTALGRTVRPTRAVIL